MTVVAFLALRLPAATIIALMSLGKLATYPHSARGAWWPWPGGIPSLVFLAIASVELALAGLVLVAPADVAIPTTAAALGLLTAYGVLAVKRTGRCGCAGGDSTTTVNRLIQRNGSLAVAAIGGEILAPNVAMTTLRDIAPITGFLPAVLLTGIGVYETYRLRRAG